MFGGLNEGLIKTYSIDFTILRVSMLLSKLNIPYDIIKNENNTISIKLDNFFDLKEEGLDYINTSLINLHGWFPSFIKSVNRNGMKMDIGYNEKWILDRKEILDKVEIIYESKFDKTVDTPPFLYHLSIVDYSDKILSRGLFPKSKNKIGTHYDRIYLCSEVKYCYDLINNNKKWIIYKIDTNGLEITLYDDPNYKDKGFYLYSNIPPSNITIYDSEK